MTEATKIQALIALSRDWRFDCENGFLSQNSGGFRYPPSGSNVLKSEWIPILRDFANANWDILSVRQKRHILAALQAWMCERKQLTTGQLLGTTGRKIE